MIIQYPPLVVIPSAVAQQIGLVRMQAIATLTGMMVITAADAQEKHQSNHDRAVCRPDKDFAQAHHRMQEWLNLEFTDPDDPAIVTTRKLLMSALEYFQKHKDEL